MSNIHQESNILIKFSHIKDSICRHCRQSGHKSKEKQKKYTNFLFSFHLTVSSKFPFNNQQSNPPNIQVFLTLFYLLLSYLFMLLSTHLTLHCLIYHPNRSRTHIHKTLKPFFRFINFKFNIDLILFGERAFLTCRFGIGVTVGRLVIWLFE